LIYDLIIMGGGPAGYFAAERASDAGFRTLLLEERNLGGVCLNEGCIPTKSLIYAAKLKNLASHGEDYGVSADNISLDHSKTLERKNKVVQKLTGGVAASLKQRRVDAIRARGMIKSKGENGFAVEANGAVYESARLLVCTGSEPIIPAIEGVKFALGSGFALTSREILNIDNIPGRLVIVGGGAIGLELAYYFATAGSQVTVVEMLPEIGGNIDADVANTLRGALEKLGICFMLQTKAVGFESDGMRVLKPSAVEDTIHADKVLLSIGRKPRIGDAGLETLGIYIEKGAIVTDARMRTSVPGVWAAGDVNGKLMLAHTAYREAAVAINDMTGVCDFMRYDAIPQVIYTSPEAAGVGETEQSALTKGYRFDVANVPLQYSGRFLAENDSKEGFLKVLSDRRIGRVIGVHMVGPYASEIILSGAILVGSKLSAIAACKIAYPHPTVGEVFRDALIELTERGKK